MATLAEKIAENITPDLELCYQKYIKGEMCVIEFEYDGHNSGSIYRFKALDKWWTVSEISSNVFFTDTDQSSLWWFLDIGTIDININLILRKIVIENYMLVISNDWGEARIFIKEDNLFNVESNVNEIIQNHLSVWGNIKHFWYNRDINEKAMIKTLMFIIKSDDAHFHFEKHYYNHDENIKSNLIKRYYKNSLVNYNTKFGMNKMFDSFVF